MSFAAANSTFRVITASFAAGVGIMLLVGLVAPVAVQGGLNVRDAMAATVQAKAPAIEPLDLVAVQAQLNEAERSMYVARAATDDAIARLEQLSDR